MSSSAGTRGCTLVRVPSVLQAETDADPWGGRGLDRAIKWRASDGGDRQSGPEEGGAAAPALRDEKKLDFLVTFVSSVLDTLDAGEGEKRREVAAAKEGQKCKVGDMEVSAAEGATPEWYSLKNGLEKWPSPPTTRSWKDAKKEGARAPGSRSPGSRYSKLRPSGLGSMLKSPPEERACPARSANIDEKLQTALGAARHGQARNASTPTTAPQVLIFALCRCWGRLRSRWGGVGRPGDGRATWAGLARPARRSLAGPC